MLGLIAGELLAEEIMTMEPHPLLATFRPTRFASALSALVQSVGGYRRVTILGKG